MRQLLYSFWFVLFFALAYPAIGNSADSKTCEFQKILLKQEIIGNNDDGHNSHWEGMIGNFKLKLIGQQALRGIVILKASITNLKNSKTCELQIDEDGVTPAIYITTPIQRLYLLKSYGSGDEISVFDVATCHEIPMDLDVEFAKFSKDTINSIGECEGLGNSMYSCTVNPPSYKLDQNCDAIKQQQLKKTTTRIMKLPLE